MDQEECVVALKCPPPWNGRMEPIKCAKMEPFGNEGIEPFLGGLLECWPPKGLPSESGLLQMERRALQEGTLWLKEVPIRTLRRNIPSRSES